jgi:hypothetical protein
MSPLITSVEDALAVAEHAPITPTDSLKGLVVLLDEGLQRHGRAAADRLDHVVGAGEDAGLEVERHLADVLHDKRLLELAPLQLLRFVADGDPDDS